MSEAQETLDEIWAGDLFNRRSEAEQLSAYIESVATRSQSREDSYSFTIAVDVGYGQGKTFFLSRLAKHLSRRHPVAFIDAWADDLADEPLTALAATLKAALEPLVVENASLGKKFGEFLKTSGKVAKVITIGAVRRAAGVVFTSAAVETAEHIVKDAGESTQDIAISGAKAGAEGIVQSADSALRRVSPQKLMKERVASFEAGQAAIREMKESLSAIVDGLGGERVAPIVIIVDELDRCRPTYAIKLLEEVKHLFDVPGIVFVFGLHGEQLSQSIRGAYGADFKGDDYLRRFIGRRYRLRDPDLQPLLQKLLEEAGITSDDFFPLEIEAAGFAPRVMPIEFELARHMQSYGLTVRDAFQVLDMLQTCVALSAGDKLVAAYIFPLIMSFVRGADPGSLIKPERDDPKLHYVLHPYSGTRLQWTFADMAEELRLRFTLSERDLRKRMNDNSDLLTEFAYERRVRAQKRPGDPGNYGFLLESVGQFGPKPEREEG